MKNLIGFLLVVGFLSGCGSNIYPSEYAAAEVACTNNGGIDHIFDGRKLNIVYCSNGAEFRINTKED